MQSCWSCLVVIENGATICPLCGADQTPLPPISDCEAAILHGSKSVVLRWGISAVAILCLLGAAAWYITQTNDDDSPAKAEAAATNALVNIRLALSQYAISKGDKYPSTLEPLEAQAKAPEENARTKGYAMVYTPLRSESDGMIRGFVLLAQPEKGDCRNFYIDQTGVMRATQERRHARIDDPPI
jgi:type II secretory pathway pseudopilin PulG